MSEAVRKKSRVRFNAADMLIFAALLLLLFTLLSSFVFKDEAPVQKRMVLLIDESDAHQMALLSISAAKGSNVYDAESGLLLGTLEEDYISGGEKMLILLSEEAVKSGAYYFRQTVGIYVDKVLTKNAVIDRIEEAGET